MATIAPKVPLTSARSAGPRYYRPAGGFNPAAVALAVVAGSAAAAVVAVVYVYAVRYIPLIKLNVLFTIAAGAAFGAVPAVILKQFKVRSPAATLIACGLVGLVGLYASWVVWEASLLDGSTADNVKALVLHPSEVVDWGVKIEPVGTWSMGHGYSGSRTESSNVSGTFLLLIWAAEALILVGMAPIIGRSMIGSVPFCDACGTWCGAKQLVRQTATVDDPSVVRQRLETGDFAYVDTLGPPAGDGSGLEFHRHTCPSCKQFNTLSVSDRTVVRDKKGKVRSNNVKTVVDKLLVTPADLAKLTPGTA